MNFFITSETTFDVTRSELRVLRDFQDALNRNASDLQIAGVDMVGIVLVVMNPEVAPPFPAGVVFRRTRKELDLRPAVAFAEWMAADRRGRIRLLIHATVAVLKSHPTKTVSEQELSAFEQALQRGSQALLN